MILCPEKVQNNVTTGQQQPLLSGQLKILKILIKEILKLKNLLKTLNIGHKVIQLFASETSSAGNSSSRAPPGCL